MCAEWRVARQGKSLKRLDEEMSLEATKCAMLRSAVETDYLLNGPTMSEVGGLRKNHAAVFWRCLGAFPDHLVSNYALAVSFSTVASVRPKLADYGLALWNAGETDYRTTCLDS